eukprot:3752346-Pyramimonas_sp.AAC.2
MALWHSGITVGSSAPRSAHGGACSDGEVRAGIDPPSLLGRSKGHRGSPFGPVPKTSKQTAYSIQIRRCGLTLTDTDKTYLTYL